MPSLVVTLFWAAAASIIGASSAAAADWPVTYSWSAELVAVDTRARTVVLRHAVSGDAVHGAISLKEGDRVVIEWSVTVKADGIRSVTRGKTAGGRYSIPVEFIRLDDHHLTFRLPVPAVHVESLRDVEPGTRVTTISPQATWQPDGIVLHIGAAQYHLTDATEATASYAARLDRYLGLRPEVDTYADLFARQLGPWFVVQEASL